MVFGKIPHREEKVLKIYCDLVPCPDGCKKDDKGMAMKKRMCGWLVAGCVILVLVIRWFVADVIFVKGSSMYPAFHDKDMVIVSKLINDYMRYDVVVLFTGRGNLIKRIIGMPGDTVQIVNGCVMINGHLLDDEYALEPMKDAGIAAESVFLCDDEYFVLGDNRNQSEDSRSGEIGKIEKKQIVGIVRYKIRGR